MGHSNGIFGYFAGERLGLYALIGCACILLAMILGDLLLPALNTLFQRRNSAISPFPVYLATFSYKNLQALLHFV